MLPSPANPSTVSPVTRRILLAFLLALLLPRSTPATEATTSIDEGLDRGIAFLVTSQNPDGSWGSPHRTKDLNIYAPVPGAHHAFRAAVTALAIAALIETDASSRVADAGSVLERAETWFLEHLPRVRRADATAIYNIWTHAYALQALAAMHDRAASDTPRRERIRELVLDQIDRLRRYESVDGGWGYYDFRVGTQRPAADTLSFVSATVLVAFHDARRTGVGIPDDLVRRAVASIHRQRKPDHSYLYGEYLEHRPMRPINRAAGSLGRSQTCNLALRLWGDTGVTDTVVTDWLQRLIDRNDWLSFGRKRPIPHESWFEVAGYFYYYGHYYAARCLDILEPADASRFRPQLAALLLDLQEKDGSWWDYPLYNYHQPYGTAFALMTLHRCRPAPEP